MAKKVKGKGKATKPRPVAARRAKAKRPHGKVEPKPQPKPKSKSKPKSAPIATAPPQVAPQEKIPISKAKGRPMLSWVGKRPLHSVTAFPAQPVESFTVSDADKVPKADKAIWKDWPDRYPHGGLLFHGDNKEVLAHLLANGFRGKVQLIYIDPPFDSGADYVRKVSLRGAEGSAKLDGESYALGEQIQYTDIWGNDSYLQFMYERLALLKELLAQDGSIWLHCDAHRSHLLRCLLEEVFGADNFRNEVIREKQRGGKHHANLAVGSIHDTLLHFSKAQKYTWNEIRRDIPERILIQRYPLEDDIGRYALADCTNFKVARPNLTYEFLGFTRTWKWTQDEMLRKYKEGEVVQISPGNIPRRKVRPNPDGDKLQSIWYDVADTEKESDYPTEKASSLLERIIEVSSNPFSIVLDCFIGSGTTAVAAQKLGRRWIGCDINKGAIQTTAKRLQAVMAEQVESGTKGSVQQDLLPDEKTKPALPAQLVFTVWRVNDYDLTVQHNEAVNLACEHIGVTRTLGDGFFDGTWGKKLVKIVPFGHPLSPADLEDVKRELDIRQKESRDVVMVCLGKELGVDAWLIDYNRVRKQGDAPNKIEVIELRSDPKYGKFIQHKPAQVRVDIRRVKDRDGENIFVDIKDFISPSIVERLQTQASLLAPKIPDWRAMVDSVMIDTAYDGRVFNVVLADVPERKQDYVEGRYEIPAPKGSTTMVAVKVTDMLGEEVVFTKEI